MEYFLIIKFTLKCEEIISSFFSREMFVTPVRS